MVGAFYQQWCRTDIQHSNWESTCLTRAILTNSQEMQRWTNYGQGNCNTCMHKRNKRNSLRPSDVTWDHKSFFTIGSLPEPKKKQIQGNLNQHKNALKENALQDVICRMCAILSKPQCGNETLVRSLPGAPGLPQLAPLCQLLARHYAVPRALILLGAEHCRLMEALARQNSWLPVQR